MPAEFHMNVFDAVVLSVFALSAIIAFFRGFIRELLSLGAWVGAAIITIYLFPHSTKFLSHYVKNENMAAGMGALGTYILALILISILNSVILKYVKTGAEVGLLDNFLGLVFGCLRGAFIVSLAYLILLSIIPKSNPPEWLETSFTKQYLEEGGELLARVAPKYLEDLEGIVKAQKQNIDDRRKNAEEEDIKAGNRRELNRITDSLKQ